MKLSVGQAVAHALAQSWRPSVPPLNLPHDSLASVASVLLPTGGGALLWRRLPQSEFREAGPAALVRDAYRQHTLHAALREREIVELLKFFDSAGIQPLLAKGWAVARLYPEKGLRPFGDIDLLIRKEDYARASAMLAAPDAPACCVDLHAEFRELADRPAKQLFDRSQTVLLSGVPVHIMGAEDQLRHLCLHMLADGMWRPLWLCDVALIAETIPKNFDWNLCLGADHRRRKWIACALGLAHVLLKADIGGLPMQESARNLPRWLVPAVLRQWEKNEHYMQGDSMSVRLRNPRTFVPGLQLRWPNPIQATVCTGGAFSEAPRLPFQIAECVRRGLNFIGRPWKKDM